MPWAKIGGTIERVNTILKVLVNRFCLGNMNEDTHHGFSSYRLLPPLLFQPLLPLPPSLLVHAPIVHDLSRRLHTVSAKDIT